MGAHLIFFIIFPLFSCIILTNQSLPWYSLRSGFQCDTNMAAVFSGMRPASTRQTSMYQSPSTGPALQYPTFELNVEICMESGRYYRLTFNYLLFWSISCSSAWLATVLGLSTFTI